MTKILKWNIFLILLIQFVYAQNGKISVTSSPSGSWIRVDSILVGKTPIMDIQVQAGEHTIDVAPPKGGVWNYEDKHFEVFIKEDQDTTLNISFAKPVFINSNPYGAHLKTDRDYIGITPLYLSFDNNRGTSFEIVKEGYEPFKFVLDTPDPIHAKLKKSKGYIEQQREKPQLLGLLPKKHVKSKFTLLAVTVATHWASFYFKNVADEKYDKYLQTADPQLMDKYWDETRKYDRISEITLGVSYTALAGLIYLVIWK
jgi:hypothetical protein